MAALRDGDQPTFQKLLKDNPAAAGRKGPHGVTPLMYACLYGDAAAARAEEEPRGALAAVSGTLLAFFTSLFPGVLPEQPNGAPFAQPQPAGGF